jgi:N-acetylneuraminic acid mutarotase
LTIYKQLFKPAMKKIFIIFAFLFAFSANAQDWVKLSDKPFERTEHTSAMIPGDDKVLIFGGYVNGYGNDTWLYDLSDGFWQQQNPANVPGGRLDHAMAFIGDDKVLLFGGYDDSYLADTWLYDISDGNWTQLNPQNTPPGRRAHGMCYIGDDKVLLFGGYSNDLYNDTWMFDLSDGDWTDLNPGVEPSERANFGFSYLGGTRALLFGGYDGGNLNDTWIFDLQFNVWVEQNPVDKPSIRGGCSMSYVSDGKTLLFGGENSGNRFNETWQFDDSNKNWTNLNPANPPEARFSTSLSLIAGDKFLLFGGETDVYLGDTRLFDLSENSWTEAGQMPTPRFAHDMAFLGNGHAVLFGGRNDYNDYHDNTWIFNIDDKSFEELNPANEPAERFYYSLCHIGDDRAILFGGEVSGNWNNETWLFDYSDGDWTQQNPGNAPSARGNHAACYVGGDMVLLFGGEGASDFDDETWLYDLGDNTWTQLNPANKPSPRNSHRMSYIGGDKVLLFGGLDEFYDEDDETWLFDLSDNNWTQLNPASKPSPRTNPSMDYLGGDKVLLFGGHDGDYDDETWVFDLSENNWVKLNTAHLPGPRTYHASAGFNTGEVIIHGGIDGDYLGDYWYFSYDLPSAQLIEPAPNAQQVDTNTTFRWGSIELCDSYQIQVSTTNNFSAILKDSTVSDTTLSIPGFLPETEYFWRVRGIINGRPGDWSAARSFTTRDKPLEKPVLTIPANNSQNQRITNLQFEWNEVPNREGYRIEISEDANFTVIIKDTIIYDEIYIYRGIFTYSKTYFWRIHTWKGQEQQVSDTWQFETRDNNLAALPASWNFTGQTGTSASVQVPVNINPVILNRVFLNGDAVGFFFRDGGNEKCAGHGEWDGSDLTVTIWGDDPQTPEKDGFAGNENYIIKIWDAQEGKEYYGVVTYDSGNEFFTANGQSVLSKLEATEAITQTIALAQGWNIISARVTAAKALMDSIFNAIKDDIVIVKNSAGQSYIPAFGLNLIGNWNLHEGYQVYAETAVNLEINGLPAIPENEDIFLVMGWHIVAYLGSEPLSAVDALKSLTDAGVLVIVKDSNGNAYIPAFGINNIGDIQPGQGYQMYLDDNGTLTYPAE